MTWIQDETLAWVNRWRVAGGCLLWDRLPRGRFVALSGRRSAPAVQRAGAAQEGGPSSPGAPVHMQLRHGNLPGADPGSVRASTLGDSFAGEYDRIADVAHCSTVLHGGWLVLDCNWSSVHIVPVEDIVQHTVEVDDDCVCGTTVEHGSHGYVVMHHSLDGREHREPR